MYISNLRIIGAEISSKLELREEEGQYRFFVVYDTKVANLTTAIAVWEVTMPQLIHPRSGSNWA